MPDMTADKLRRQIANLEQQLATIEATDAATAVSPLRPKYGFPDLPIVDGVQFSTASSGTKYKGRDDIMLATLSAGTTIAGVFTTSSTRAAPVLDCQKKLGGPSNDGAAIMVNAGNANAFTGSFGQVSVDVLASSVARALEISPERVFTSSTGVIGEPLDHDRIVAKIAELTQKLDPASARSAARAIMTTDTFAKGARQTLTTATGQQIQIAGFAKGSGMIAPDMATMLVYVFTDARISQESLQTLVSERSQRTFNCITVDSDTSTSDTLLVCATGRSDVGNLDHGDPKVMNDFAVALEQVMLDLAHQVVRDGEGATKFITVAVAGAENDSDARLAAFAIANSPLVKTAVAGEDPNWGRIVMAVGKSGAAADRDRLTIKFGDILVAKNGWVAPSYQEQDGARYMKQEDIEISVDLGLGSGNATVWTCDFTKRYIEINADYRS